MKKVHHPSNVLRINRVRKVLLIPLGQWLAKVKPVLTVLTAR